ncbi:GlxA family transcriptional regulator [Stappia sp. F7233]|uniref:GlxA family transcriptional regulator n=2 Tax=Stappia albiluteola TaxID=2758565 RepID=A0A839AEY9_9HYPH|nr:GlxA family transcriptional regulator [Stappia albiluteola]
MAFASASEPLRAANRLAGKNLYAWHILSPEGGAVTSSSGFDLQTQSLENAPALDRVVIVASLDIEKLHDKKVTNFLKRLAVGGKALGALSTGTFVLARAGLLSGYRCTLHWESLRQFSEEFPTIQVCREIYVRDRNRWTCAGGIAAVDMMLDQISSDYNGQLAADVADQFMHSRIRGAQEQQRMEIQWRYGVHDQRINAAIACMEENLENLIEIGEIARQSSLSLRHMERLWLQHFGMTPQRFYVSVRLKEARRLLRESTEPIVSIALRCGFVSASHMGSAYKRTFGLSPGEERRRADRH